MDKAREFVGDVQPPSYPDLPENSKSHKDRKAASQSFMLAVGHRFATRYLWDLYHAKRAAEHQGYGDNLTRYNDDPIGTWESFMQYYNNLPFKGLKLMEAFHFTKYAVKPLWEDPRNQAGGAWHLRLKDMGGTIPGGKEEEPKVKNDNRGPQDKDQKQELKELGLFGTIVFMAANDDFAEVMEPEKDDMCVVSFIKRWTGSSIVIWNRRAEAEKSVQGIKELVLSKASDADRAWLQMGDNCVYKKHRDDRKFKAELANRLLAEYTAKNDVPNVGKVDT